MFQDLMNLTRIDDNKFEAPPSPDKGARTFGGQLLAHAVRAAQATVGNTQTVHSLHAYFLRPGDVNSPAQIRVERVRDGRSFASRQIIISQQQKELFRMNSSFQAEETSPAYAGSRMPDVPSPDAVTTTYSDFTLKLLQQDSWPGQSRPMDILYINPPVQRDAAITEDQLMWMRIRGAVPADPELHSAALAYLSDSTLVDHVMLPHGMRWTDDNFTGASLDHSMWFHQPARADQWLLYVQNVEATGRGRGLARGRYFTQDGELVATCIQEGLMRWV